MRSRVLSYGLKIFNPYSQVIICTTVLMLFLTGCTPSPRFHNDPHTGKFKVGQTWTGKASWYGPKFHGRKTANGETYDMNGMTAAHRKLPFNTIIEVTLLSSGKSCRVRINDRGPFKGNRILDLSKGAAQKIGLIAEGVGKVRIRIVSVGRK